MLSNKASMVDDESAEKMCLTYCLDVTNCFLRFVDSVVLSHTEIDGRRRLIYYSPQKQRGLRCGLSTSLGATPRCRHNDRPGTINQYSMQLRPDVGGHFKMVV